MKRALASNIHMVKTIPGLFILSPTKKLATAKSYEKKCLKAGTTLIF
jgi:hypothetical protein